MTEITHDIAREDRDELSFDHPVFDAANIQALVAREGEAEAAAQDAELALVEWLAAQTWSEFAVSLADQHARKGSLSPKQWAAAQSMKAKMDAKAAAKAQAMAAPAPTADPNGIDLTDLPSSTYGVPGGDTRLKVRVRHVTKGRWEGWTFVDDGAEYGQRRNYGRQAPGATYQGEIQEQLRAILADPRAAVAEYGRLTGRCGVCNAKLEDETSVAMGIGPVCAGRF